MINGWAGRIARAQLPAILFATTILAILLPAPSAADATLEYTIETKLPARESSTATMWLADGKVTLKSGGARPARVIYWAKGDRLAMISDAKKSYIEMTGDELREMAGSLDAMSGQMATVMGSLTPEQKAMMDAQMKKMGVKGDGASARSTEIEVLMLSETKMLQGFKCQKHDVIRGGAKRAEAWLTQAADTTATSAEMMSMTGMINLITLLLDSMSSMTKSIGLDLSLPTGLVRGMEGVPVYVKDLDGDAIRSEMTLQSLKRGKIDKSVFEIGDGYKKQDLSMTR